MSAKPAASTGTASASITKRIRDLGDWRGETLARVRQLIHDADPGIQEEWKWAKAKSPGTPVWSHDGIVCTGETYKQVVKLTFARGASLPDPRKLFNSSLEGSTRRAIDIREGETLDEAAFKELIRSAGAANSTARTRGPSPKAEGRGTSAKAPTRSTSAKAGARSASSKTRARRASPKARARGASTKARARGASTKR